MTTGQRLKELRKKRGLNQTEVGEILGLSYSAISAIEQDRSEMTSGALKKISEYFGVSADYLLSGKEGTSDISAEEREILSVIRDDKAMRSAMMEIARVKKKAISYLGSYKQAEHQAAV